MRIMMKGGSWKEGEDETLKAAVMEYGKYDWARVSSRLVRKSAKQCRSRWYKCLDPSIQNVLWTRKEDEKLMHHAKLMPTQWRRIASIVGRASSQCLERYGKLVVPHRASKTACPEPVGLDEDEKEMVSEARARLTNTKGKMAKRRARENQLEEARRLASLHRKRKPEGINYVAAIRFQKRALADEDHPALPTTTEGLEAQLDVARHKIAQRQDAPAAMLQANILNDPESTWKRPKLVLPSNNELKGIEKMGYASDLLAENEELPEGSAALLAKNSQTPRQGTVAGKGEAAVMEAENLARLTDSQTPLLGGENPELHPSHFSAGTQGKEETQTPDPMVSPSMTPGAAAALTPRIGLTPSRDELHLNEEDIDMDESEELMIGEETEPEAEEDNAGMTLVTLKLLCHFKRRRHTNFRDKVDNIMGRGGRVSIEVGRRHFEKDYEYLIVSISALEDFEEEISPTLEAARQLFSCCCHCRGKPHLQRLLLGVSEIGLVADRLNSFHTSYIDFVSDGTNQEIFRGIYKGIQTNIAEDHSNMFERFTIKLWGPRNEVKSAFEEAIVELRRNCFAFPPN